jgi:hypothetical protein
LRNRTNRPWDTNLRSSCDRAPDEERFYAEGAEEVEEEIEKFKK